MKRCFLENDLEIDSFDQLDFEYLTGLNWDKAFEYVITDAARLKPSVWKAIKECDEIYMSTHFIGASAKLLHEMIEMALGAGLRDKKVINLIHKKHMQTWIPDVILKELTDRNISFFFREDLKVINQ